MLIFLVLGYGLKQNMKYEMAELILNHVIARSYEAATRQSPNVFEIAEPAPSGTRGSPRNDIKKVFSLLLCLSASLLLFQGNAQARLENSVKENQRQYGNELISKQFSENNRNFSGKKTYNLPLYGWQIEAIYRDGRSFSEAARPIGSKVKKEMISEKEANVIADMLYPRKERGRYRKQINNAHFISHFFEEGVVSYEMQLDNKKKNHLGVIGVRTVLYSDGKRFKSIKVNAYH